LQWLALPLHHSVGSIAAIMARLLSLVLLTPVVISAGTQNGLSQATGTSDSAITLRLRVARSCELLQKGTLVSEGGYATVRVDGVVEEIYSPELSKDDIIGYPIGTPQDLVKLAQKSRFRMKPVSDTEVSDLPKVVGREKDAPCPILEKALQTAQQDRLDRRRQLQSTLFRPGFDGVSPPEALQTPQPKAESQDVSSSSQSSQPAAGTRFKLRQGTVVLSVVVASNGDVEQVKIVRSVSPDVDQKAVQTASTWKFKPARKVGLPVPVLINIEINFHLY